YKALSYVWGDTNGRTEILVDGCRLGITPNLDIAIRHLFVGGHLQPRVWIDAICVNQADKAERSAQVLLMRRLYQNAERVVVWLGTYPTIQGQDKTFELIRDLTHDQEETPISIQDEEDATTWQPTAAALANFQEKLGDKSLIWVAELIDEDLFERHSWWKRMWVVQEITVSTKATVHRGHHHVRWSDITRVIRWLNKKIMTRARFDEPYVGGATVLEAWVRTLMADQIYPGKRVTDDQIIAFCQCRYPPTFLETHEPKERFRRFFGTLARAFIYGIRDRRLIMTKRGYIGTVPREAEVGDFVCILAGCDVPVVLRKIADSGDNTYTLVSGAYVHGIMDGEVEQLLDKNIVSI
ncbi:hypothetical protein N431DRAFT_290645, partial [Stipitochalara longipes BDJ]